VKGKESTSPSWLRVGWMRVGVKEMGRELRKQLSQCVDEVA